MAEPASVVHTEAPRLPDDLAPVKKVASKYGRHVNSLFRAIFRESDPLPAYKVCGRWYVSWSEFAEWVGRCSRPQSATPVPEPNFTPRRRREIAAAVAEARQLMQAR